MKRPSNQGLQLQNHWLARVASVLFWLLVWQAAAMALHQPLLLSSPFRVAERLFALLGERAFYAALGYSLRRIALGFFAGFLLGALLAMLAARLPLMEALLRPLMVTVKSVPVASFIILALIWLSAFIAFLMVLPIAYGNLLSGLKSTPTQLLEMARLYHVSWGRRLLYIQLPHIKPHLLSALTLALGMSWKAGVAAEEIGIPTGSIGEQLYQSKVYFDLTSLYAWTVAIVLVSVLFEKAVLLAVRLLYGRLERL
mgnify:CR=1 FL=1